MAVMRAGLAVTGVSRRPMRPWGFAGPIGNVTGAGVAGASVVMTIPVTGVNAVLRIVSQPANGTVGLVNGVATYFPGEGFTGTDTFTFAAYDGAKNSNLGTGTVTMSKTGYRTQTVAITAGTTDPNLHFTNPGKPVAIRFDQLSGGRVGAYAFTVDKVTLDTNFIQALPQN